MKIKIFQDKFSENKTDGLIFEPHTNFRIIRSSLEFGNTNQHRQDGIAKIDIGQVKNFEILIDFKMVNDYGNDTWWIGIKNRSTDAYLGDGYLVYIRSNGNIAVYTGAADLPDSVTQISEPILNKKIHLRISVIDNKFSFEVNDKKVTYVDKSQRLMRDGHLYLYANHTKNKIYSIKVWKIIKIREILLNKLVLTVGFIILLAIIINIGYHYWPESIDAIIKDPRVQFWSILK